MNIPIRRYPGAIQDSDCLAIEEPLEIRIGDMPLAITMRTPGQDIELAAGFCFTEGIVDHPDQIEQIVPCHVADYGNVITVTLTEEAQQHRHEAILQARREMYLSSSCGLCGTQSIAKLSRKISIQRQDYVIDSLILADLPQQMAEQQATFAQTGGLHAAAWFTPRGELKLIQEDIGRHNAVDKVIGALVLTSQVPAPFGVLLLSGRASFELVQKAARAGIAFLAAVGAPSSLAVQAANDWGLTLVGFLREHRWNVYAGVERLS